MEGTNVEQIKFEFVPIELIKQSSLGNVRDDFDENKIRELAEDLKNVGIIQPIIVRNVNGHKEIVAGERRWRAAKQAGLKKLPCLVGNYTDEVARSIMEHENLHRVDLNPIDEAKLFNKYIKEGKEAKEIAARFSIPEKYVYQRSKLTLLEDEIQKELASEKLPVTHGLLLLLVRKKNDRLRLCQESVEGKLSYRQLETKVVNLQYEINKALFDTSVCVNCSDNENKQANLFDSEKAWKGRCLNARCFQKKTDDFVAGRRKELENDGFRVTVDINEFHKHITFEDVPGDDGECMLCRDRIWFVLVGDYSKGEAGLVMESRCSDPDCYKKKADSYKKPAVTTSGSNDGDNSRGTTSSEPSVRKINQETATSSKIKAYRHEVMGTRLIFEAGQEDHSEPTINWEILQLYHLVLNGWKKDIDNDCVTAFLKENNLDGDNLSFDDRPKELLNLLSNTSVEQIRKMTKFILASFYLPSSSSFSTNRYGQEQVFQIACFMGIDLGKVFKFDEEYLNLYKKNQLLDLVRRLNLPLTSKQMASKKLVVQAIIGSGKIDAPEEWTDVEAVIHEPVLPQPVKVKK